MHRRENPADPTSDPRFGAAVDLLGRTGASGFRIGFSDPDDGDPIIWYAVAVWAQGAEAAASMNPLAAVLRLCETVIDGGTCNHCNRRTVFDPEPQDGLVDDMLDLLGCRYRFDDESVSFVRSCAVAL